MNCLQLKETENEREGEGGGFWWVCGLINKVNQGGWAPISSHFLCLVLVSLG